MYNGDQARKKVLIEHGFRLPSAADNRPLNSYEFWEKANQTVFISATPGNWELGLSKGEIVEHGSHDELIKLNGKYKKLHDLQFNPNN